MDKILSKIGLIEEFSMEIPIPVDELVIKMNEIVDEDVYKVFPSGKNNYKGKIDIKGFTIRKVLKSFDTDNSNVTVYGSFIGRNEDTLIKVKTVGYDAFMKFWYCVACLILILILSFILTSIIKNDFDFRLLLILIFCVFILLMPYISMKLGVQKMKYNLERDLYYLTKK
jgi:hypothetical protein